MLLQHYIRKHVLHEWLLIFIMITAVLLSFMIIITFNEIGHVPNIEIIMQLIVGSLPQICMIVLPLSWIIGLLMALNQLTERYELLAMVTLGFSQNKIIKSLWSMTIILSVFALIISSFMVPLAKKHLDYTLEQNKHRWVFEMIQPKEFSQIKGMKSRNPIVFYVENKKGHSHLEDVFIVYEQLNTEQWVIKSSRVDQGGDMYQKEMLLQGGELWREQLDHHGFDHIDFEQLHVRLPPNVMPSSLKHKMITELWSMAPRADAFRMINAQLFPGFSVIALLLLAGQLIINHPRQQKNILAISSSIIVIFYVIRMLQDRLMIYDGWHNITILFLPYIWLLVVSILLNVWRRSRG